MFDYVDFQLNALAVLASRGRTSGRDLLIEINRRMSKSYSYRTLYSRMRHMEEAQLVISDEEDEGKRKIRYFEITDKGKKKRIELLSDKQKKVESEPETDAHPQPAAKVKSR